MSICVFQQRPLATHRPASSLSSLCVKCEQLSNSPEIARIGFPGLHPPTRLNVKLSRGRLSLLNLSKELRA